MEKLNLNPDRHLQAAPGKTAFDYGMAVAKAGSVAFPFLGAGVVLVDLVTAPLRGKRMNDWCEELRLCLNKLSAEVEGLTPEALATSDSFISALAQATQAALKTHHAEKLEALRNAVLNVAAGTAPPDDLQLIFLSLVDSFTPTHLQALAYFNSRDPSLILRFREGQPEISDLAVRDLRDHTLLRDTRPYVAQPRELPPGSLMAQGFQITNLGRQFLDFITAPEPAR
jgi:hypothetical protein